MPNAPTPTHGTLWIKYGCVSAWSLPIALGIVPVSSLSVKYKVVSAWSLPIASMIVRPRAGSGGPAFDARERLTNRLLARDGQIRGEGHVPSKAGGDATIEENALCNKRAP